MFPDFLFYTSENTGMSQIQNQLIKSALSMDPVHNRKQVFTQKWTLHHELSSFKMKEFVLHIHLHIIPAYLKIRSD